VLDSKVKRQLEAIDWDFPVALPGTTKLAHWYPGTFPAQLPATFIQACSDYGDIVFDPYGGAGTTASEAIRLGRKAWITDINPIGILANYSYSALLILMNSSNEKFKLFIQNIRSLLAIKNADSPGFQFDDMTNNLEGVDSLFEKHMRPKPKDLHVKIRGERKFNIEALKKWIHPRTLEEIIDVYQRINTSSNGAFIKLFTEAMISSNLRALCSQNKSWGHIADNVYPKEFVYKDVTKQLTLWLNSLEKSISKCAIEGSRKYTGIQYWVDIHNWNTNKKVTVRPRDSAKLLITSPPYADAIDYLYAQKISLYFLGYDDNDITSFCKQEIGARRKRFKTTSRETWADELTAAALKQKEYLDGPFVTIMPHKNHGREIGLKKMIKGLKDDGWQEAFKVDRSIDQKKTRQSWTSIKQETINIFTKE